MNRRLNAHFVNLSILLAFQAAATAQTIGSIPLPNGFERTTLAAGSFGFFLRQLELKKDKTVYLYNGEKKTNQQVQYAVIDISTGNKDLQQCADACMRLRAEYLKGINRPVCFADNNQKQYCWQQYIQKGWQSYLETVFGMCGSLSLEKQLKQQTWANLTPGDILIHGGSPGHAVIVMDVAKNPTTGVRIFLLAQSYMPAQDIHILLNFNNTSISQWYQITSDPLIKTPQWVFSKKELKKW
jgi:hypothetical protein